MIADACCPHSVHSKNTQHPLQYLFGTSYGNFGGQGGLAHLAIDGGKPE